MVNNRCHQVQMLGHAQSIFHVFQLSLLTNLYPIFTIIMNHSLPYIYHNHQPVFTINQSSALTNVCHLSIVTTDQSFSSNITINQSLPSIRHDHQPVFTIKDLSPLINLSHLSIVAINQMHSHYLDIAIILSNLYQPVFLSTNNQD